MSCCGGKCGCGPDCKCCGGGGGCGGCKMQPELSHSEETTAETLVMGVGPVDTTGGSSEGASDMEFGAENGCKCGPSCSCDPCTCK